METNKANIVDLADDIKSSLNKIMILIGDILDETLNSSIYERHDMSEPFKVEYAQAKCDMCLDYVQKATENAGQIISLLEGNENA